MTGTSSHSTPRPAWRQPPEDPRPSAPSACPGGSLPPGLPGLPLSTTHCQVGGTVGVGMLEGVSRGVNWPLALRFVGGWLMTLVVAGLLSAALFAQGAYAPCA